MPTYTLITVTHGGEVRHARGFESLRMCQEARSIALTGLTIAEVEERERQHQAWAAEAARRQVENRERQWRARRPPRPPTTEEREGFRTLRLSWPVTPLEGWQEQLYEAAGNYVLAKTSYATLGDDGLVREHFQIIGGGGSSGQLVSGRRPETGEIRYARCVIELPDAPGTPWSSLMPSEVA